MGTGKAGLSPAVSDRDFNTAPGLPRSFLTSRDGATLLNRLIPG